MFYNTSSTDKGNYSDHYRLFSLFPSMYLFSTLGGYLVKFGKVHG